MDSFQCRDVDLYHSVCHSQRRFHLVDVCLGGLYLFFAQCGCSPDCDHSGAPAHPLYDGTFYGINQHRYGGTHAEVSAKCLNGFLGCGTVVPRLKYRKWGCKFLVFAL